MFVVFRSYWLTSLTNYVTLANMTQQDMTQQHMTQQQQQQLLATYFSTGQQMEQIARNRPPELINGFVPSSGVMVLAGAPGTGKSFTALSWAAAIAEGSQWFGRQTRKAPVVYVLGEGYSAFGERITAWKTTNGREIPEDLLFMDGATLGIDLKAPVEQLIGIFNLVKPGLIVFDTLSVLTRLTSENDNAEVSQVMANVHTIAQATGATAMVIHHTTKSTGSVRGASAFVGNADTVVVAAKEKNEGNAATSTFLLSTSAQHGGKQRSGEPKMMSGFSIAAPGVLAHGSSSNSGNSPTARKDPNDINVIMAAAKAVHEENKNKENK